MSEMYGERDTKYEENRRCDELQKMWGELQKMSR